MGRWGGSSWAGWGKHFILLNQFVSSFQEPPHQKRARVFPCKLPPLISLSDALHQYQDTPETRAWGEQKVQKPRWEQQPCAPPLSAADYLIHSHVKQTAGRGGTQVERSPQARVICRDLCRAPRLPLTTLHQVISFSLFISARRISLPPFLFPPLPPAPPVYLFCHVFFYPAPAHPAPVASSFLLLCTCVRVSKIAAHEDIKTRRLHFFRSACTVRATCR